MLPTSLGLLLPAFGPERKGAAIGLWSAVGGRGGRPRPPDRRAAGPGQLALGLPGQPALRRRGARPRRPRARRGPGPRRPQVRPARGGPADRRRGQPGGRHRRGLGLGLDQRAHPRRLRAGRRRRRRARPALLPAPQPHHRAGRDPPPGRGAGRPQLARLLRRLRGARPRRRPAPHRALARVGAAGRVHDRPRTAAGRAHRLPGRAAGRPLRAPGRRHRRRAALRRRRACGGSPTSAPSRTGRATTCRGACSAASASASCSRRWAVRPRHRCRPSASPPGPRSTS